jgi:phosphoglycolate phosphatase
MAVPILVFDLDGTLADTAPDLLAALATVLPRYGFRGNGDATFRDGIGHGVRHLIEYALRLQHAQADARTIDAMHRDFLSHYEANICVGSSLYQGIPEMFDRFAAAGWSFALCTNKPERLSRRLLEELRISKRFAAISGGDTFAVRKPDPGHLLATIASAGGSRSRSVMVGDSRTDLDTARGAAIPFIGVTFGYTPVPMADLDPDLLVDCFDELTPERAYDLIDRKTPAAPLEQNAVPAS